MTNKVALALKRAEKRVTAEPEISTPLAQILAMQELLVLDFLEAKTKPALRARLSTAFCFLEDRRCRLKGIPNPGQLRPDLDPVQLARANKRARQRQSIDVAANATSEVQLPIEPEALQPSTTAEMPSCQAPALSEKKEIP